MRRTLILAALACAAGWGQTDECKPSVWKKVKTPALSRPAIQRRPGAAGCACQMGGDFAAGLRPISTSGTFAAIGQSPSIRIACARGAAKFHAILDSYSIAHSFEVYTGTSAVAGRFQNHVMPFFSRNLCASGRC